jgi:predicted GIY-YIG superfamily endonuclease
MVTVYVLKSLIDDIHYVGMAKDAIVRLKEHNGGKNYFTKGHTSSKIIYTETHPDWAVARVREKYLKTAAGKKWLYKHLPFTEGSEGSLPA